MSGFLKSFIILDILDMQLTTRLRLMPRLKMRVATLCPLSHTFCECGTVQLYVLVECDRVRAMCLGLIILCVRFLMYVGWLMLGKE